MIYLGHRKNNKFRVSIITKIHVTYQNIKIQYNENWLASSFDLAEKFLLNKQRQYTYIKSC